MEVSAVIITKNEEKMIEDCLKSLDWVDEILLVDGGSYDATISIARKYKARVAKHATNDYSEQRRRGLKEAKGKWIFYIDADERVTPSLRDEILSTISSQQLTIKAFAVPRRNFIFGKEFRHSGQWPDYQKRLFLRSNLHSWKGEVHEEPIFEGELGHLKTPMLHIKHEDLSEMVDKTNNWSAVEAKLMFEAKHPPMNIVRFMTAMIREFWLRMIRQTAFLDGTEGIIYALYQVYSRFISYAKLWEMQIQIKNLTAKRVTQLKI